MHRLTIPLIERERPFSSWDPQQHLRDCPNCYETTKSLPGAYTLSLLIGCICPLGGQRAIINCGLPHWTDRVSYHSQRKHDLRICIIAHRKLFRLEAGPASHNPGWTDWQSPSHRHHNINICNGRKVFEGSLAIHTGCHDHLYRAIHRGMAYRPFHNSHHTARLHTTVAQHCSREQYELSMDNVVPFFFSGGDLTYDELPRHHQIKFAIYYLFTNDKTIDIVLQSSGDHERTRQSGQKHLQTTTTTKATLLCGTMRFKLDTRILAKLIVLQCMIAWVGHWLILPLLAYADRCRSEKMYSKVIQPRSLSSHLSLPWHCRRKRALDCRRWDWITDRVSTPFFFAALIHIIAWMGVIYSRHAITSKLPQHGPCHDIMCLISC